MGLGGEWKGARGRGWEKELAVYPFIFCAPLRFDSNSVLGELCLDSIDRTGGASRWRRRV